MALLVPRTGVLECFLVNCLGAGVAIRPRHYMRDPGSFRIVVLFGLARRSAQWRLCSVLENASVELLWTLRQRWRLHRFPEAGSLLLFVVVLALQACLRRRF